MKTLTGIENYHLFCQAYLVQALIKDKTAYEQTGKNYYWLILQNSGFSKEQFLSFLLDEDRDFDKAATDYLKSIKNSDLRELYEEWSKPALLTIFVGNRILDELDKLYPGIDMRPK